MLTPIFFTDDVLLPIQTGWYVGGLHTNCGTDLLTNNNRSPLAVAVACARADAAQLLLDAGE